MLSKNQIKLIKSLSQKKFRTQYGLFTVEGIKGITEFLNSDYKVHHIYATDPIFDIDSERLSIISEQDLKRISSLKSPNTALGVFRIPEPKVVNTTGLVVALDAVRDPGNLGTIIRLCDWYGITELICGNDTVDCYNTKVVQASMGSLTRVNVSYQDIKSFLSNESIVSFGTFLNGENIYEVVLPDQGVIIMGNEANGISHDIETLVNRRITIPQFGNIKATESLNVATATAIVLSEFRRTATEK